MLKKTKNEKNLAAPNSDTVSVAGKTIIGEQVSIDGSIQGREDLVIEGAVKGSVKLEKYHLIVGSKGKVEAEIHAGNVTISGRVIGNVKAQEKVAITKEADFNGDIKAKRISVEDGAYLKAVIEVEREEQKKAVSPGKTVEMASPGPDKEPITLASEAEKRK
jgi:cytoskeletal protein CcmA (bactofilin family)